MLCPHGRVHWTRNGDLVGLSDTTVSPPMNTTELVSFLLRPFSLSLVTSYHLLLPAGPSCDSLRTAV